MKAVRPKPAAAAGADIEERGASALRPSLVYKAKMSGPHLWIYLPPGTKGETESDAIRSMGMACLGALSHLADVPAQTKENATMMGTAIFEMILVWAGIPQAEEGEAVTLMSPPTPITWIEYGNGCCGIEVRWQEALSVYWNIWRAGPRFKETPAGVREAARKRKQKERHGFVVDGAFRIEVHAPERMTELKDDAEAYTMEFRGDSESRLLPLRDGLPRSLREAFDRMIEGDPMDATETEKRTKRRLIERLRDETVRDVTRM